MMALDEHTKIKEENLQELALAIRIGINADEKKWIEFIRG